MIRSLIQTFVILAVATATTHAQLRINEFMARNQATLADEDGDYEDWIEIHNPGQSPVDVGGWSLTDDSANPAKWTFPEHTLEPGGFLVVFASAKDRRVAPNKLHTNFKLSAAGEYLALVNPLGTAEQSFSPSFLPQLADVSFGITSRPSRERTLIGEPHSVQAFVPDNNALGDQWKLPEFNDSSWLTGNSGVGYERSPFSATSFDELISLDLEEQVYDKSETIYLRFPFELTTPRAYHSLLLKLRYDDGFAAFLNGARVASDNVPPSLNYDSGAPEIRVGSDSSTLQFTDFDLSHHLDSLQVGTNVLAIHLLNKGKTSSDLLCIPQLKATASIDGDPGYMTEATPASPNREGNLGQVDDTRFSVDRGYFEQPFEVEITTRSVGATIRYTLDGSPPSSNTGNPYSEPIQITGTTTLRAIASLPGYASSDIDTQTYLFPEQVMTQTGDDLRSNNWGHAGPDWEMDPEVLALDDPSLKPTTNDLLSLPAISIVMDWDDMFGNGGIYISGEGVERACSIEMIDPMGAGDEFQINAAIQIFGGTSVNRWKNDKLSMRVKFKDGYGPAKLNYPVFGPEAADEFNTLVIDARSNNVWHYGGGVTPPTQRIRGQFIRDQVVADMQLAMGGLAPHGRHVFVYLNGVFWGIHTLHERPDDSFASSYLPGEREEFDSIKHNPNDVTGGSNEEYKRLLDLADRDLSVLANYEEVAALVDIPALADYILLNYFVGNTDWAHHNWYATRKREDPAGLWRYHSWDAEHTFKDPADDITGKNNPSGPTGLHQRLMSSQEYKLIFNDRLQKHFHQNGVLTTDRAKSIYQSRADSVSAAIRVESARWGDNLRQVPYTRQDWLNELDRLMADYIPVRNQAVQQQLLDGGFLLPTPVPVATHPGGLVPENFTLTITTPHGLYLTTDGSDPRSYGSGSPSVPLHNGTLSIDRSMRVKARAYARRQWSPLVELDFFVDTAPALQISEIMYHAHLPSAEEHPETFDSDDFDFIEIHNPSPFTYGLVGMTFTEGVRFDFGTGSTLSIEPGQHLVIVANAVAFRARYPDVPDAVILGEYQGKLDDGGEDLTIHWSALGNSRTISYNDGRGWFPTTDGAGHSLIPLAPDPELLESSYYWRPSGDRGGSPGTVDLTSEAPVVINEFAARTNTAEEDFDSDDWVELYALPGSTINPADWFLSDDPDELLQSQCTEPAGPGDHLWSLGEVPRSSGGLSFGLNKDGEHLFLTYAPGGVIVRVADAITFKGQQLGTSLGRFPDGSDSWMPMPATRNLPNQPPEAGIRLHEILYNHPDGETFEYLVLHNSNTSPVSLWNASDSWRLNGDLDYLLPAGLSIEPQAYLVIVFFDPSDEPSRIRFISQLGLPAANLQLVGPCPGTLPDRSGRIALEKPQEPGANGQPDSWVIVDEASYFSHEPFPDSAAGTGLALHRVANDRSGNLFSNWSSGFPSPASDSIIWPLPELTIRTIPPDGVRLEFDTFPGFNYQLESTESLDSDSWEPRLRAVGSGRIIHQEPKTKPTRFFRVLQSE